jgi:hypothetical protein
VLQEAVRPILTNQSDGRALGHGSARTYRHVWRAVAWGADPSDSVTGYAPCDPSYPVSDLPGDLSDRDQHFREGVVSRHRSSFEITVTLTALFVIRRPAFREEFEPPIHRLGLHTPRRLLPWR